METRTKDLAGQAKGFAREAQETIKESAGEFAEKAKSLGSSAKQNAMAAYQAAQSKTVAGAQATDKAIRDNPYAALGIAFGCGLLIGFLAKRK
jgi:ElaB/YqjD/DUF883 family membrane-anchored ribosome-binding protein